MRKLTHCGISRGKALSLRGLIVVFALALLGGCAAAPPPPPPPPPPPVLLTPDAACLQALSDDHATFQALGSFGRGNCRIDNPVRLTAGDVPWNHPGILSCAMARTLVEFDTEVVQPLAHRYFGQGIRRLDHFGTYDCRSRRTESSAAGLGTSKGGRLSEHARGRAIDLAGFELDDGTKVTVKRDWHRGGATGGFLHAVARAACRRFNVVLTPNYNRLHQDHIHMDIGPYTLCGY